MRQQVILLLVTLVVVLLVQKSTVDRIDYSNDTATAAVKGPLSLARHGVTATGNSSFGYFGGGAGIYSTVDRIDYSNDTATAVEKRTIESC